MKPKIETALAYMMGVVALVALIAWCAALTLGWFGRMAALARIIQEVHHYGV